MHKLCNRLLKATLTTILLSVVSVTSTGAFAQFGTKFACCRPESVSCLGGGGATIWHKTLADRALTQVDAGARCIATGARLNWNTHSCPQGSSCADGSGGGTTNPPAQPTSSTAVIRNQSRQTAFIGIQEYPNLAPTSTRAWYRLDPGASWTFTIARSHCVAIQQNGVDYIKTKQDQGFFFTGTIHSMKIHPSNRTDVDYSFDSDASYWVNIFIPGVRDPVQYFDGFSYDGLQALFDSSGMATYKCFFQNSGDTFHYSVEP